MSDWGSFGKHTHTLPRVCAHTRTAMQTLTHVNTHTFVYKSMQIHTHTHTTGQRLKHTQTTNQALARTHTHRQPLDTHTPAMQTYTQIHTERPNRPEVPFLDKTSYANGVQLR